MLNHIHITCYAPSLQKLIRFGQQITSQFARLSNARKAKEPVYFEVEKKWFSSKMTDKDKKSCYIYLANNPVEKSAAIRPQDYKWGFFQTYSDTPTIDETTMSKRLKKYSSYLLKINPHDRYLNYKLLDRWFDDLPENEATTLENLIIRRYLDLDTMDIRKLFGSINKFFTATEYNQGGDYDLYEPYEKENYSHYRNMTDLLLKEGYFGNDLSLKKEDFNLDGLIKKMQILSGSTQLEVKRFFHLE